MRTWIPVLLIAASMAHGAKYVDPLNGSDASDGSMASPWKSLQNIHQLVDTVYVSNSAVCHFGPLSRTPYDVTIQSWGDAMPSIVFSNTDASARGPFRIEDANSWRLVLRNLRLVCPIEFTDDRLIYLRNAGRTVDIENCVFDIAVTNTNGETITLRTRGVYLRLHDNLVIGSPIRPLVNAFGDTTDTASTIDFRYNRLYHCRTGLSLSHLCNVVVANNTAFASDYLVRVYVGDLAVSNINNIVDNVTGGGRWFYGNAVDTRPFCDYNFSGDSAGSTYVNPVQGGNDQIGLTPAQLAFLETNDPLNELFLKIDNTSVAAMSDAAGAYPDLGLAAFAGWAAPVPEPAALALACAGIAVGFIRRRGGY
ncbi:PEP-CTERM sorting domain-containing protein [bacterium]|nr:PEP-CTERM sorting domain-containing protein [bacterium]